MTPQDHGTSSKPIAADATPMTDIPFSYLDTDLYKLTMQNAVLKLYPDLRCTYRFTNRNSNQLFSRRCFARYQSLVNHLSSMRLSPDERTYLESLGFFPSTYLDFLEELRLNPVEQVRMEWVHDIEESDKQGKEVGAIVVSLEGLWREIILYEVPLMALLSEAYFAIDDTDWTKDLQAVQNLANQKSLRLLSSSCAFSEFGTRRRRSYKVQEAVLEGLMSGAREFAGKQDGTSGGGGVFVGTSNVHFAMKYNLRPVGTIAHEWIMAIGALEDYVRPNGRAMDQWEAVYPAKLGSPLHTMLTDTYTLPLFLTEFKSDPERARRWTALRQDSGVPIEFARQVKAAWDEIDGDRAGEAPRRRVIFSDGLDVENAIKIRDGCDKLGIAASFGIGTSLTNDFKRSSSPSETSRPLNIVIKLASIDGKPTVKLTDDKGKAAGSREDVESAIRKLGLE